MLQTRELLYSLYWFTMAAIKFSEEDHLHKKTSATDVPFRRPSENNFLPVFLFYTLFPCIMAIVETSQPLSIESFSYSWLINLEPSIESISDSFRAALDSSDDSSFIEMDPNMPASKRFKKLKDFDFDLPFLKQSTASILHADELFSNGLLVPLVDTSKTTANSSPSSPLFSNGQKRKASRADRKIHCSSLRRCRSLVSRKTFEKYLYFLCPFLAKIRCCRSKSRKDRASDNNSIWNVKDNRPYSPQASPRTSVGSSAGDWRRSCDSESSIHEAVLHCKKSIGM